MKFLLVALIVLVTLFAAYKIIMRRESVLTKNTYTISSPDGIVDITLPRSFEPPSHLSWDLGSSLNSYSSKRLHETGLAWLSESGLASREFISYRYYKDKRIELGGIVKKPVRLQLLLFQDAGDVEQRTQNLTSPTPLLGERLYSCCEELRQLVNSTSWEVLRDDTSSQLLFGAYEEPDPPAADGIQRSIFILSQKTAGYQLILHYFADEYRQKDMRTFLEGLPEVIRIDAPGMQKVFEMLADAEKRDETLPRCEVIDRQWVCT